MNFIHYEFDTDRGDVIEVSIDKQANVRLLDDSNFSNYRRGQRHSYRGGLVKQSPVRLATPHSGRWHVVVDLGGHSGTVNASARLIAGF